ncbi:MAG: SIR2 family NAD-dependent protein deacylase, partial [Armatimonadota bacterium]
TATEQAADVLAEAALSGGSIVAFTGAGISQESGIPTFRGADGIWQRYDPEAVATYEGFVADPALCWRFHEALRELCRQAKPNAAHLALTWINAATGDDSAVPVITQNIDGLHQAAGSSHVLELHGSCHRMRCTECDFVTDEMPEQFDALPPVCDCGALLRPDLVWFGEQLPREAMAEAERLAQTASVMLVVGTSATVQPAASLPVIALRSGATLIEANFEPTPLTAMAEISLRGPAGASLPALAEAVGARVNGAGADDHHDR